MPPARTASRPCWPSRRSSCAGSCAAPAPTFVAAGKLLTQQEGRTICGPPAHAATARQESILPPNAALRHIKRETRLCVSPFFRSSDPLPPVGNYSSMPITTPEPTVRPPSRIAKRRPFSIAMGVISSTFMSTLSPGMHISTPSGRVMTPVTSVVRK